MEGNGRRRREQARARTRASINIPGKAAALLAHRQAGRDQHIWLTVHPTQRGGGSSQLLLDDGGDALGERRWRLPLPTAAGASAVTSPRWPVANPWLQLLLEMPFRTRAHHHGESCRPPVNGFYY